MQIGDILTPEPAGPVTVLVGYGRTARGGPDHDGQITALESAGCERVFVDAAAGRDVPRPELAQCLDYLRPRDVLVVTALPRLGRSLPDLIDIVAELRRREVGLRSQAEGIDTTSAGGRLVFHVFACLAEFVRELMTERSRDGLADARDRGRRLGRPPALDTDRIRQARRLLTNPDESVTSIARLLDVSRTTLYKHVPELRPDGGGRPALAAAVRAEILAADDAAQLPGQTAIPLDADGTPEAEPGGTGPGR